ncbi:MAG: flotillin family protein [Planctomycetes bacterium]|nr:flotillin family protein [Planctomycetota bacterium]
MHSTTILGLASLLADGDASSGIFIAAAIVGTIFVFVLVFAARYQKVGPNEVLVISGMKMRGGRIQRTDGTVERFGFRWVRGGGTFIVPVLETYKVLSLELMTLEVRTPEVYTITGVPVIVDGVVQIKVEGTDESITTAAEQFLDKRTSEIMEIAHQTIEGHLRAIIGQMKIEEIYKDREAFSQRVQENASPDMRKMGISIISFTLKDIKDNQGYLDALGKPHVAVVKRDAIIAQAEADRDANIRSAEANQKGMEAKYIADTQIAESKRDYEMRQAEYEASVNTKRADADLAYELQKHIVGQKVKEQEINVEIVERQKRTELQEKEIQRREKELDATVRRPAEAEQYRILQIAEAEKGRLTREAEGRAQAERSQGMAAADVTKAQGLARAEAERAAGMARADVIGAQGAAEAEAMAKKARSWKAYGEAALASMLIERLPELARAIAEPLSKTEKIVIVGGSGDGGAGASRVTRDVTNILAQLPPAVEALTGVDFKDLTQIVKNRLKTSNGKDDEVESDS